MGDKAMDTKGIRSRNPEIDKHDEISNFSDRILNGEIKMHDLDNILGKAKAAEARRLFLEKKLNIDLPVVSSSTISPDSCISNIENMIGSVQVPLGIAGPIKVDGDYAKGEFFVPLATTEGALVASVNRGMKAINLSGGASVLIIKDEQARSILFTFCELGKIKEFLVWIEAEKEKLIKEGEKGSSHLKIKEIESYVVGLSVWLRIKAETGNAMGMNMITITGKQIGDYISESFKDARFMTESGNMCTDKKPSSMNLINSRGKRVVANVLLKEHVITEVLKTTSAKLIELNYRKNMLGSAASGSLGFNSHFANMIAAIFIATGQDPAHVVDGSLGFTTAEKCEEGINFSVTLADLQIGTIGGGTGLPAQRECLSIMGLSADEENSSRKFGEIIAAAVLAGELSLLAALCTKDLAASHKRLNR